MLTFLSPRRLNCVKTCPPALVCLPCWSALLGTARDSRRNQFWWPNLIYCAVLDRRLIISQQRQTQSRAYKVGFKVIQTLIIEFSPPLPARPIRSVKYRESRWVVVRINKSKWIGQVACDDRRVARNDGKSSIIFGSVI